RERSLVQACGTCIRRLPAVACIGRSTICVCRLTRRSREESRYVSLGATGELDRATQVRPENPDPVGRAQQGRVVTDFRLRGIGPGPELNRVSLLCDAEQGGAAARICLRVTERADELSSVVAEDSQVKSEPLLEWLDRTAPSVLLLRLQREWRGIRLTK